MNSIPSNLPSILSAFSNKKILVVGDLILDVYLKGEVKRISPEAPVPVLLYDSEESRLGGAGNVALNLKRLNAEVYLFGSLGKDEKGKRIIEMLEVQGIHTDLIMESSEMITSVKTRVIGDQQQIVRIDREKKKNPAKSLFDQNLSCMESLGVKFDAIIISDYGKGIIHTHLLERMIKYAQREGIYLALDPKEENFPIYHDLDIMTPNAKEAMNDFKLDSENEGNFIEIGKKLIQKHRLKNLIITLGKDGLILFDRDQAISIPSFTRSVFDVSGAGDTVIATFVLAYLSSSNITHAAIIANLAASVVVSKFGTSTVSTQEIIRELDRYQQSHLPQLIKQEKISN